MEKDSQKQNVHKDERHFGDEEDAHDHGAIEHVHGPDGDVKFHSGMEEHHKGPEICCQKCKLVAFFKNGFFFQAKTSSLKQ